MISRYFQENVDHLTQWEPKREKDFYEVSHWKQRLIKLHELQRMALGYYLVILDTETNQMMGTVSFSNISRHPFHACSVGYSMHKDHQGKGVMKRALKMAIEYMFEEQNLHRIMAAYIPTNRRSEAVLEALGFVKEGFAKDYLLINGEWRDHNLTALVNSNWRQQPV
ncbi:GNAT family N-acetyltransferase [Vibrio sp. SCSIO 43136]|nr:GNAT family N-acetyltransferase [Vibrio sp. SCSIO 43136]